MTTPSNDQRPSRAYLIPWFMWLGSVSAAPYMIHKVITDSGDASFGWPMIGVVMLVHVFASMRIGESSGPGAGVWACLGGWFIMGASVLGGCVTLIKRI